MPSIPPIEEDKSSDKKTFDMYHFFSRKDTIAAAVMIVALLFWLAYRVFAGNHQV